MFIIAYLVSVKLYHQRQPVNGYDLNQVKLIWLNEKHTPRVESPPSLSVVVINQ
jgi:hypothetical protein